MASNYKDIKKKLKKDDMAQLIKLLYAPTKGAELPLGLGQTLDLSLHLARIIESGPGAAPTSDGPPTPAVQK